MYISSKVTWFLKYHCAFTVHQGNLRATNKQRLSSDSLSVVFQGIWGKNILSFAWKETKIHKVLCHSLTEMLHQQSRAQGFLSPVCTHSITYLKEKQLLEAEG